ncbi:MAG: alpha/beta hydrolase [Solirubrobacterales bacterium]|nr:alpha/beta hydrolase [Solirubrobacterales bacterium]
MAERMIEVNGVELCTEPFGDPADRPILLIQGVGASMLWWDEGFCRALAGAGRFVVRYDHRDTGRSISCAPGHPGYTGADLGADAAGVLDAYGIACAHVVGVSAGGELLALEFPERVRSLVLISTSTAVPGDRDLPAPTDQFGGFLSTTTVDWSDRDSVVEYVVGYSRMLAGDRRQFDEAHMRALVRHEVERAPLPRARTTTCSPRASPRARRCPRSPHQRSSSTAPRTRCSPPSTERRSRTRSPMRDC